MKNKIYYLGMLCCILIWIGGSLKIQHWPMAGITFTLSMGTLILIFLPIAFVNSFKAEENKKILSLYIIAFVTFGFNFVAGLFKIQHWPGAGILLVIAIPLPFILFLPAYILYVKKDKTVNYNHLLTVLFFFAYFGAITALLGLGISKNKIDELVINASQTKEINRNIEEQNRILNSFVQTKSLDSLKRESIKNIIKSSGELCSYMDKLMNAIVKKSEKQDLAGTERNYFKIRNKDAYFPSDYVMIYKENGKELIRKFKTYKKLLISESKINDKVTLDYLNEMLETNGNGEFSWNEEIFIQRHTIAALWFLEILKKRVLMAQMEAITTLSEI